MENYSVLMAVYYREQAEYLHQAIDSMLCQTVPPEEFVLVCDGPLTQALDAVITKYQVAQPERFQIIRLERNMGLGAALHIGLQCCRNELVARMDSDDIAVTDRMEAQLAQLRCFPGTAVLGGQIAEFWSVPECVMSYREVPQEPQEILQFAKSRNPMNHVTVLLRKSAVLEAGNYSQTVSPGFEDYYLWVTLLAKGYELRNISKVCCKVRVSEGQYARRGGWRFFQNAMQVMRLLKKQRMISHIRLWMNTAVWFAGTMLIPTGFRKQLLLRFLRRQESFEEAPQVCGRGKLLL